MGKETLLWMTDIRDEYVLDAFYKVPDVEKYVRKEDREEEHPVPAKACRAEKEKRIAGCETVAGSKQKKTKRKGAVLMYLGIGFGAAAVAAAVWMGGSRWMNQENTPIQEPVTLEETTESMFGLEENELLVIPIAQSEKNESVLVDGNRNLVGIYPNLQRYAFEAAEIRNSEDLWGLEYDQEKDAINPYMIQTDENLICGEEKMGIFSLAEQTWLVEPEYDYIFPIGEDRYLTQKVTEEGTKFDAQLRNGEGVILHSWSGLEEIMKTDGGYLIAENIIYDSDGNHVMSTQNAEFIGIRQDTALVSNQEMANLLDLKNKKVIDTGTALNTGVSLYNVAVTHDSFWELDLDTGEKLIYDIRAGKMITMESFIDQNQLSKTIQTMGILAYDEAADQILVYSSEGRTRIRISEEPGLNVYLCDGSWNVIQSYEDVMGIGILDQNAYGLMEASSDGVSGYEIIDFWSGERRTVPEEVPVEDAERLLVPAKGWIGYEILDEGGLTQDVLTLGEELVIKDVRSFEAYEEAILCDFVTEENVHVKTYYSLDGRTLSSEIIPEFLCFLSGQTAAVRMEDELVFMDWDGKEVGRISLTAE